MKRGQVKMLENVFILVIFFILLVIGITFYTKVSTKSAEIYARQLTGEEAVKKSQKLLHLPEVQCTSDLPELTAIENCVDIYKLKAFEEVARDQGDMFLDYYYDIFGYSSFTVKQVYPSTIKILTSELGITPGSPDSPTGDYQVVDREYNEIQAPEWVVYNKTPDEIVDSRRAAVPVLLFDETVRPLGSFSLGMVVIEVYS
ncbi:hypothetical protein KY330_00735 [Candidatus Woesearchaeota archaeon]|nr:hypothetical protein [Candidatus Woesearchaeota archaeon]